MSIQEALSNYHNSLFYNEEWHRLAIEGDIDSIVNIGTDFARYEMMEYAVACWQYVINNGHGTAEAYSNLGVSYYYGNGVDILLECTTLLLHVRTEMALPKTWIRLLNIIKWQLSMA